MDVPRFGEQGQVFELGAPDRFLMRADTGWVYRYETRYGIGNGLILQDTPPNTWPQYVDMGIGHEGKKIYLKWWKWVDVSLCFSFMMKTAGYSLAHAMLQALYFSSVSKKVMKSHNRK